MNPLVAVARRRSILTAPRLIIRNTPGPPS